MTTAPQYPPPHRWTADEYLAFERASAFRHELIDGQIYDMVGASRRHNRITVDAGFALHRQLQGGSCEVFISDMRVQLGNDHYAYPDIVVICEGKTGDSTADSVTDPVVLIEVLSPSTEAYDRDRKWHHYRAIPSLQVYILIAQDRPHAEVWTRTGTFEWLFSDINGLDAMIALPVIGCSLLLQDLYRRIDFNDAE